MNLPAGDLHVIFPQSTAQSHSGRDFSNSRKTGSRPGSGPAFCLKTDAWGSEFSGDFVPWTLQRRYLILRGL
jgi:hypothetical protein